MNFKQFLHFAIGPLGVALISIISLPITAWYFNQDDIGRISMLQVVLGFTTLIFSFGLDQAYVRFFHESNNRHLLFQASFFPGFLSILTVLAIFFIFGWKLSNLLFDVDSIFMSFLIGVSILSVFVIRFMSLIYRMNNEGLYFSLTQIAPKFIILILVFSCLTFELSNDFITLFYINVFSVFSVALIVFLFVNSKHSIFSLNNPGVFNVKELINFGFPLILGGVAFWGVTATDKLLLRYFSSYDELGLYTVVVSFASIATILQSIFSTVWAPLIYRWVDEGKGIGDINAISNYILLSVIVFFSLVGMFSWILPVFLPVEYYSIKWLVISCLAFPLLYTLSEATSVGIGISKRSNYSMISSVIALIINFLGNWFLIPILGASGAAISTCVSFFVFFIVRTESSIYLWEKIPRFRLYLYSLLCTIGAVFNTLLGESYHKVFIFYWFILLISCFVFFRFEIKSLYRILNK